MTAIKEIGDRLDGKPRQSMDMAHHNRPLRELTDDELTAIIRGNRARDGPEADPEQLN